MKRGRSKRGRGIPLLPNGLTAANLLCGFFSLVNSHHGRFGEAALLILFAAFLDALDGRVARLTGSSSGFGKEFDSLADLVSFGVAPGFLLYSWGLEGSRIGWLTAFLFVACGALRLARFNVGMRDRGSFQGLPIPAAGCLLATLYLFSERVGFAQQVMPQLLVPLAFILSFLMVSSIPYPSFKQWEPFRRKPFSSLVAFVLMMVVLLSEPKVTLFVLTVFYVLTGPLGSLKKVRRPEPEES